MRRLRHADSPEVVRVSEDSPESSFRELDDVFLQTQARIWLGEVLHIRFSDETAIADLIADGELLFQVSKVVWKMLLKKNVEMKSSKIFIYERTSFAKGDGRYMPYPKVDSFLKICQILGLKGIDLFSPSDVVEKKNVRRVCMCIRSLSRKVRLRNLNVPDFDIVKYTIAMPTNLVGGICRHLEQARQSSSCSSEGSRGSRESNRKISYSKNQDHYHDSLSESDEAECGYTEIEIESPYFGASHSNAVLFNVAGDSPDESSEDESLPDLQEDFLAESYKHGESPHDSIYSVEVKPVIHSLNSSDSGNQVCNSLVSYRNCVSSSNNSVYGTETQTGEREAHVDRMSSGNYLSECSNTVCHANPGEKKEEMMEVLVGCGSEHMSSTGYESDRRENECRVLHEDSQGDYSTELLESYERCSNGIWILNTEHEDVSMRSCKNHKGGQTSNNINWYINGESTASHDVRHKDSSSHVQSYLQATKSICSSNTCSPSSEALGGTCMRVGPRDSSEDIAHEYEKTDEYNVDISSTTSLEVVKEAAVVITHDQCYHSKKCDNYATVFLLPEVHNCKLIENYCIREDLSLNKQGTDTNGRENTEGLYRSSFYLKSETRELHASAYEETNCATTLSSTVEPLQVSLGVMDSGNMSYTLSTSNSMESFQPQWSDDLCEFGALPSKGQNATDIPDSCNYNKSNDFALSDTCSSVDETKSASSIVLSTCMSDKKHIPNSILESDANQLLKDSTEHKDDVAALLSIGESKAHKSKVTSMDDLENELFPECDSATKVNMERKLVRQNGGLYHQPSEAHNNLVLDTKEILEEREGSNSFNWFVESEYIQQSLRKSSSATTGTDNKYDHPLSSSKVNKLTVNDIAEIKPLQNLKFDNVDETENIMQAEEPGATRGYSSIESHCSSDCRYTEMSTQYDDDSIPSDQILSTPGYIAGEQGIAAEEKNLAVEDKIPLFLDEQGTRKNSETRAEDQKRGKTVLVSVARGVTVIGALFVLLHMRKRRNKENHNQIFEHLQTQR